jgi:GalNAc-alpha-(1->4)-GalNAc-alpha-(1->3)-diNAcBac-PP-undecaprenol alpha-1,4-N-acetyl-D-galactosaminyltransferase
MKLTFVISSLGAGGAERIMSLMANYWAAKGWEITILTLDDETPFYQLDAQVNHIGLGIQQNSSNVLMGGWNNFRRIQALQGAIASLKPEVVISFIDQTNVLTILATRSLNLRVIVSEHIDPTLYSIGSTWDLLRRWTYPFASRVVVLTQRTSDYFLSELRLPTHVIPNPVISPSKFEQISTGDPKRSLVAMGRLTPQKGFDLSIKAFAKLKDKYPDWILTILGEGELRAELEALRDKLKLQARVYFPGAVKNVYEILQQADIFILSSRFEGFPIALCEAMAYGLPVIATDCPSGPREIIRDGIDGILVPSEDVAALSGAMAGLMGDKQKRADLSIRATEVVERFSIEKIMSMWAELLAEVVKEKG